MSARGPDADDGETTYVESPIITTTVRVVAPFVLTFGLFLVLHGADASGGGFQGGVVVGAVVVMIGLAFGVRVTGEWVGTTLPLALLGVGVLAFALVGLGPLLFGGAFLEYAAYPVDHASTYGIELVELAIGFVVTGVVVGLFFGLEAGVRPPGGDDR